MRWRVEKKWREDAKRISKLAARQPKFKAAIEQPGQRKHHQFWEYLPAILDDPTDLDPESFEKMQAGIPSAGEVCTRREAVCLPRVHDWKQAGWEEKGWGSR